MTNSQNGLPTDPEIIDKYLWVLTRIEKEREITPEGETIPYPKHNAQQMSKGILTTQEEDSILRSLEQRRIIEITIKKRELYFEFAPGVTDYIRAIRIPDLDKFKNYRDKLLELKEALKKELIEEVGKKIKEQIKPLKELGKQISLVARSSHIKEYDEAFRKISEQIAPLKDILEEVSRLQSTYAIHAKNYLTPALQRLITPIRQIEEQMKRFELFLEDLEYPKEAFISSDVIQAKQGAETISELREIRKLIEKSTTKKDEPIRIKWFNYKNNSISFYGDIYKPRNEPQAKFIRQLVMKCQRENNNGTVLKGGQRVSEKNLSSKINLTMEQIRYIRKQLNRSFKDKGFPLKIDLNAEGILLIYTI